MAPYTVFVVHPGVPYSTADVYSGVVAGLDANGVTVVGHRLDQTIEYQVAAYNAGALIGAFKDTERPIFPAIVGPFALSHALDVWPDLVLVISAHNLHITTARLLRKVGLKTAVFFTESPYFREFERAMAGVYDTVFTMERRAVGLFDRPRVHYLPHAYHPEIHQPGLPDRAKACDVCFIGSLFRERAALFNGVDWSGISFVRRGIELDTPPPGDIIGNDETAAYYRSAAISLNHHRTTMDHQSGEHIAPGSAESLGPRAYEIAACGGFQLCDDSRPELLDVFGDSVPTYRAGDSASLEREIRHWLRVPDSRAALAQAAHEAVRSHSWANRAKQLLEYVL